MRRLALVLLLGAAAAPARAGEDAKAPAQEKPTLCGCLKDKRCWGVLKAAFTDVFTAKRKEVDGALGGRFFPDTTTWSLAEPDKAGRFLTVECGAARAPCRDKAEILERRTLAVALLSSLPEPATGDFDPQTWEVKPEGVQLLLRAKKCRPSLWDELTKPLHVRLP